MPFSSQLFLLFLLLTPIPVAAVFTLAKGAARGGAPRSAHRVTRVLNSLLYSCLGAFSQAPTAYDTLQRTFIMMVSSTTRGDEERWKALISESETIIGTFLAPRVRTDLATLVRCVTLRLFLVVFLSVSPESLPFEQLQEVSRALYNFYNGAGELPPEIRTTLEQWLPPVRFPNSLAHILPTYEVIWRIVAATVVQCEDDETGDLRQMMLDFRDNPNDPQYKMEVEGRSVSAVINDAVTRLTPIPHMSRWTIFRWPWSFPDYHSSSEVSQAAEALKFAALVASRVMGQLGARYKLLSNGGPESEHPWEGCNIEARRVRRIEVQGAN